MSIPPTHSSPSTPLDPISQLLASHLSFDDKPNIINHDDEDDITNERFNNPFFNHTNDNSKKNREKNKEKNQKKAKNELFF